MKKKKTYISKSYLLKRIAFWRKVLGIDSIYDINISIIPMSEVSKHVDIENDAEGTIVEAFISGMNEEHPIITVYFTKEFLKNNKYNELEINSTLVHELTHIIVNDAFILFDPKYKYEGIKAKANERLTIKFTTALMAVVKNMIKRKRRKNHSTNIF